MDIFAYLDPGTGSLILQVAVGAIVGIGVAVKAYWAKIVGVFSGNKARKQSEKSNTEKQS